MIKLTQRLKKIASFVKSGDVICDAGTDHGYIPAYLISLGTVRCAYATDINEGPLENAKCTARQYGVFDKIKFYLTDGLRGVPEGDINTVIIAGMGGETIRDILRACKWVKNDKKLILQPQTKISELMGWLYDGGFGVEDMCLVKDDGRIYLIIAARFGIKPLCRDYLEYLYEKGDGLFDEYISALISRQRAIVKGLAAGKSSENEYKNAKDELFRLESFLKREGE